MRYNIVSFLDHISLREKICDANVICFHHSMINVALIYFGKIPGEDYQILEVVEGALPLVPVIP